jgi:xylan 1,4-beta-xylosidase
VTQDINHHPVQNPVLRGFNPDPSLVKVEDVYYMATSTFEWFPGIQVHRSNDLTEWALVARPLDEKRLLDIVGVPDSCGVWAPCLSFANGLFYLAYTVVKRFDGHFKDTHNYVTTSPHITGPWSDPVHINSSGFDPSIFHDTDGRSWWLNMIWDHRPDRTPFHGIVLQELDRSDLQLKGEPTLISQGSDIGLVEGPHLYRLGDYYYLIVAEGGTGYGHAISVARSRSIDGPYVFDPQGPVMTSRAHTQWPLQRSGHGSLVHLGDDDYAMSFLCSRRTNALQHSPMGRESGLANVVITDDQWIRQPNGETRPPLCFPNANEQTAAPARARAFRDAFDTQTLSNNYQWLRDSESNSWCSLTARPGFLRITGRESPGSVFKQSLIATRMTDWNCAVETCLEFTPRHFQSLAGLMIYYNSTKFHYVHVTHDPAVGRVLSVVSCLADEHLLNDYPLGSECISLTTETTFLRCEIKASYAEVFYKETNEAQWIKLPIRLDMTCLTDQAGRVSGEQFTGTFVGLAAHDLSGQAATADFAYFSYTEEQ